MGKFVMKPFHLLVAAVIVVGGIVAVTAVILTDTTGKGGSGLGEAFEYDLSQARQVDPALVGYEEAGRIETAFDEVHAIAVGPRNRIYVAGSKGTEHFLADLTAKEPGRTTAPGRPASEDVCLLPLDDAPRCLAVRSDGTIFVGMKDHIETVLLPPVTTSRPSGMEDGGKRPIIKSDGPSVTVWESPGPGTVITSIAVTDVDYFVADAGHRVVLRYQRFSDRVGRIGEKDENRNIPGFVVPSPYFDVAMAPDGLLRAANPGRFRIEAYTVDGDLEVWWGQAGTAHEGFSGCCNPAHFAITPDGAFITSEKGELRRVKLYDADGKFVCYVATPEMLGAGKAGCSGKPAEGFDVAVDSNGRVLVLDSMTRKVRIFMKKEANDG